MRQLGSDPQENLLPVQEVQEGPLDNEEADPPQHLLGRLAEHPAARFVAADEAFAAESSAPRTPAVPRTQGAA